ncbi:hypothetical protein FN846DRAFT_906826 [Sphaerosporella brunnea]|uniref:Uncharacterized protein n=1 Tax=Sphaerosporella brunnea TaxID=1250544 RepID=A0A5J5EXW5_9PEZI|nr:hypothetical protein FN846DRAFT_906826 [Sphaerosporella brunnea]
MQNNDYYYNQQQNSYSGVPFGGHGVPRQGWMLSGGSGYGPAPSPGGMLSKGDLCVAHQADYFQGQKGTFWNKISELLEQDRGIILKDTRSTMIDLVDIRKQEVERFTTGDQMSGNVQEESELTQNADLWIERLE